ncbi:hypothetical protein [uncultured Paraglaciecola sp.]|uniref:hypothetical protein n=1 Tax=uncultured Paraglaciecola sp. TaxID=1765024 RepID=UPI0030DD7002|tara:strand:+ start:4768 stop:5619 length:852 start_codon:yes stop_codon:yes gene_type:complete
MNKYIIVLCEGDHDIAFLIRVLLIQGFTFYDKKVKNFPIPFNELYQKNLGDKKIKDYEFKFQRPKPKVPYSVLTRGNTLVIFHNLDGDANFCHDGASSIVDMYLNLNKENIRKIQKYDKLNYRFLYFLDSDEQGVDARLENLKASLELPNLNNNEIQIKSDYEIGCYIFHDEEHADKHGQLEDILSKLMKSNNEDIFTGGSNFLEDNNLATERQKKYTCNSENESYGGNVQFKELKSLISVAGQLQFSGSSNAVIIANSDYIKKDDILTNPHCINITTLFEAT